MALKKKIFFLFLSQLLVIQFLSTTARDLSLHEAAFKGNIEVMKNILEKMKESNRLYYYTEDIQGHTPFHSAAYGGQVESMKLLVESKVGLAIKELENSDKNGNSPLHLAVHGNHLNMVKYLLEQNINPLPQNHYDLERETPLSMAIKLEKPSIVQTFLEREDVKSIILNNKSFRLSLLKKALESYCAETVKLIVELDQPLIAQECVELLRVRPFREYDSEKIFEEILLTVYSKEQTTQDNDSQNLVAFSEQNKVFKAAWNGDIESIINNTRCGFKDKDSKGRNLLYYAILGGQYKAARYLMLEGVSAYEEDCAGYSIERYLQIRFSPDKIVTDPLLVEQYNFLSKFIEKSLYLQVAEKLRIFEILSIYKAIHGTFSNIFLRRLT